MIAAKRSPFVKAMSIVLAFCFLSFNVSYAAPNDTSAQAAQVATQTDPKPLMAEDVGIAIDAGMVKATHDGQAGKMIVHIQDAHCNYEAQSNINKILDQLSKECGINIISVEGAEGIVDTKWFKAFPDAEIRKEVATYFMKKGEITGAEFFSITSDFNGTIYGAETREYYIKNLKAFTTVYPYKDAIEKYFQDTRTLVNKLKGIIYSAELRELDSKIGAFDAKEIELAAFAEYLNKELLKNKIDLNLYPNFKKLVDTLEYEKKINFDIVDQERSNYIDALSKKLTKEQMAELVTQSIRFKKGHIKAVEFYSMLRDLAKEHKINMLQEYPNLFYYYLYSKLYDGIDNESLFKELDLVEVGLKKKLFKDDTQETLDRVSTLVEMYVNLVNIELTNEDYDFFTACAAKTSLEEMVAFINKQCAKYNLNATMGDIPAQIKDNMPKMIDFYEIAMKRDKALIDNTINQMAKEGKDRSVLIAGGFHTKGIKELLEKQGISYVVVTPKITKDVETPYIKVLTNQRTSLEDIITENAAVPGVNITASREEIVRTKSGSMLAPLERVFYTIPLFLNDPQELHSLAEAMGAVEGRTVEDAAIATYDEIVRALVTGWLTKVKSEATPEVWNKALTKWPFLLGAYLTKYQQGAREQGINLRADFNVPAVTLSSDENAFKAVQESVSTRFAQIFSEVVESMQEPALGIQAARICMGEDGKFESMSNEQASGFDKVIAAFMGKLPAGKKQDDIRKNEVLRRSVTDGKVNLIPINVAAPRVNEEGAVQATEQKTMEICVIRGMRGARSDYNRKMVEAGTPDKQIPEDVIVVPGTGKGRWLRMYIDEDDFMTLGGDQVQRIANHEFCHVVNRTLSEDQVCALMGDDLSDIRAMFNAEAALMGDNAFGDAAAEHIKAERRKIDDLRVQGNLAEAAKLKNALAEWSRMVYERRANMDRMQNVLTGETYDGYDIIIVSSSTEDEAKYQQEVLEKLFEGRSTSNAAMKNKVCILSVLDEAEGGQIIGQLNTWRRAVPMFKQWAEKNGLEETDLDAIFSSDKIKLAVYHNGGKGERASPATQSLGNSRGAQKIVGRVTKPNGEKVDIELIPAVILSTAGIATSNNRSRIDTYWANQVAFGTIDVTKLKRSNSHFDKMAVGLPKNPNMKDLFDYGTAVIDGTGNVVKFVANKVLTKKDASGKYAPNPDYQKEFDELLASPNGALDYGSFSMSREMHYALMKFWEDKGILKRIDVTGTAGMSRDIDPALVQVTVPFVNGIARLGQLPEGFPTAASLVGLFGADKKAALEQAYESIMPSFHMEQDKQDVTKQVKVFDPTPGRLEPDFAAALDKIYSNAKTKDFVLESLEFFVLNQDLFADLGKVVGSVDLGAGSHWFAYKRMLDLSNEKFFMLSDILGQNMELGNDGTPVFTGLSQDGLDAVRAEDARRMRGITRDAVAVFIVNGELVKLSLEQVKAGWRDEKNDIEVKGSIIQGATVLLPGSRVVNSVVNDSQGKIVAQNSYIESATAKEVRSSNSIVFKAADAGTIKADKEIIADAYRPVIGKPVEDRFPEGQTRLRAPVSFDPKGVTQNDTMVFGDNRYSPQAVREMDCVRSKNDEIETSIKSELQDSLGINMGVFRPAEYFARFIAARDRDKVTEGLAYLKGLGQLTPELVNLIFAELVSQGMEPRAKVEAMYFAEQVKTTFGVPQIPFVDMAGVSKNDLQRAWDEVQEGLARIKMMDASIKALSFGTSGIRGPITREGIRTINPGMSEDMIDRMIADGGSMTDKECYINALGFIYFLEATNEIRPGDKIAVGGDLRMSSHRVEAAILRAITDAGYTPDFTGSVSSPALAYYAQESKVPSIMVTGSHIPEDRNGVKFTKISGEVLKTDEKPILSNVRKARDEVYAQTSAQSLFDADGMFKQENVQALPSSREDMVMKMYVQRYLDVFPDDYLAGKVIVVYQHSAVGRDALVDIFRGLGATVVPILRSSTFVPVDTEKVSQKTVGILEDAAKGVENPEKPGEWLKPDFIISADGDSDRPLFADENGTFLTGDRLGGLVAEKLGAKTVAVPCTTNKGILDMLAAQGVSVVKTKVGSPYIVANLEAGKEVGWEANGGFLLGQEWDLPEWKTPLKKLPTRDAPLPLILAMRLAMDKGMTASQLIATLPPWFGTGTAVTPGDTGCEMYTISMGKLITARLAPSIDIKECKFTAAGVEVQYPNDAWGTATPELAQELTALKDKMAGYFSPQRGFAEIAGLETIDGIKVIFANGQTAHVRPSGNGADFRLIPGAPTAAEDQQMGAKWPTIAPEIIAHEGVAAAVPGTLGVHAMRATPVAGTPVSRVVDSIKAGTPFYVEPYMEPKVWGRLVAAIQKIIGEYWYGAEPGAKSSTVVVGNDRVPMVEVLKYIPVAVLGMGPVMTFGETMPLVKILTPEGRLSVQFHDTKNELWIVTAVTGANPTIILGFSEVAITAHKDKVNEKYQEALISYHRALYALEALLAKDHVDVLQRTGNIEKAAEEVAGQYPQIADSLKAFQGEQDKLNEFYHLEPVWAGKVIPIPAGTLHALGAGVEVVEPQIAGATQSLEDGATWPVRYVAPEGAADHSGAQRQLDIARVGEINNRPAVITEPVVLSNQNGVTVERLPGGFESKGLEVHTITMAAGTTLVEPAIASAHNLVLLEGKAEVIVNGIQYDIPMASAKKPMLVVPASAKEYKIVSDAGAKVVDTFTPLPAQTAITVAVGPVVPATDVVSRREEVVFAGALGETSDRMTIITEANVPRIVNDREHVLRVQEGKVIVKKGNQVVAEVEAGENYAVPAGFGDYRMENAVPAQPAIVRVDYEKSKEEKAVYSTFNAVRKNMKEVNAGAVQMILPEEMYVGGQGGTNIVGSMKWSEEQIKRYVNQNVEYVPYQANAGISGLKEAAKRGVPTGVTAVLVAPQSLLNKVSEEDPDVAAFLRGERGTVRVIAIPDLDDIEDRGWFFNREVEGTGLLLAAVKPENIAAAARGEVNAASDLHQLMAQLIGKDVPIEYLYSLLGHNEIPWDEFMKSLSDDKKKALQEAMLEDPFAWLKFIVQNLLINLPITPYDATQQLEQRRKVMWAV